MNKWHYFCNSSASVNMLFALWTKSLQHPSNHISDSSACFEHPVTGDGVLVSVDCTSVVTTSTCEHLQSFIPARVHVEAAVITCGFLAYCWQFKNWLVLVIDSLKQKIHLLVQCECQQYCCSFIPAHWTSFFCPPFCPPCSCYIGLRATKVIRS